MSVEELVWGILELDQVERIEFKARMKEEVAEWKKRCKSQLRWMEELEDLGFKIGE